MKMMIIGQDTTRYASKKEHKRQAVGQVCRMIRLFKERKTVHVSTEWIEDVCMKNAQILIAVNDVQKQD